MSIQNWFITGASSGLGEAIAHAVLRAGHRVAATARDIVRLDRLAAEYPEAVLPLSMDLNSQSDIKAAVHAAEDRFGGIDVIVNNAGIGYLAAVEEGEDEKIRTLFQTNFFGVASTIREVLPGMRARGRGAIVNVSSVAGVVSFPANGYYAASKFALEGLSEALYQEVRPLGIKVMTVEPGGIRTGIVQRNLRSPKVAGYEDTAHAFMDMLLNDADSALAPGDPRRMAQLIVRLVAAGDMPQRLILGADSWDAIMAKTEAQQAEYRAYRDIAHSTYFA
ncbi:SDR family NAD(P)-dependent oxidoreductase [Cupriavidus respiraculi]|uniref:SDR family NAD(P)-dependent oxidoreductase n=1 Tax=Cupriavidus respiraculi TaxID=195930 RepID=UPI001C9487DB|nr:SDR family NAD(P)-dependent oxidoreductase [Cupriavidus respiraculi]MBY4946086.1 SDR family NAD(P)-dependent oxidoreductase [Cupriavidus respiraculi]